MKTKVIVTFDDNDKKLLKSELPKNPCKGCYLHGNGCCGCANGIEYEKLLKPYKEANILDIALKNKERLELIRDIEDKKKMVKEIEETLPNFMISTDNPFRTETWQASIRRDEVLTSSEFGVTMNDSNGTWVKLDEIQKMIDEGIISIDYDKLEKVILERNSK